MKADPAIRLVGSTAGHGPRLPPGCGSAAPAADPHVRTPACSRPGFDPRWLMSLNVPIVLMVGYAADRHGVPTDTVATLYDAPDGVGINYYWSRRAIVAHRPGRLRRAERTSGRFVLVGERNTTGLTGREGAPR